MKKLLTALITLMLCQFIHAQTINKLEYFIDVDKGIGKNKLVNVTASADGTFPFTVALADIEPGYHKLYIRARDSKGKWSITLRQTIQVLPTSDEKIITKGEYFFETDPGFGKGKKINVPKQDSMIMQNFTASIAALEPGYHKMYVRFLDNYGNWSQTSRYNVQVLKNTDTSYIVEVEYFFTKDAGVGRCASIALTPATNGEFSFVIPNDEIPDNVRKLYVRVRDSSNGDWSITRIKQVKINGIVADENESEISTDKTSFSISPNPAHNYFNISAKGLDKTTNAIILVKDVSGRLVITKKLAAFSNQQINISSLAKGSYFVTIISANYNATRKLIIQ